MNLKFPVFDGNRHGVVDITDEDNGKFVGHIRINGTGFGRSGGIEVSLFDGKYSKKLHKFEECWGFVQGVQAVLNHMVWIKE